MGFRPGWAGGLALPPAVDAAGAAAARPGGGVVPAGAGRGCAAADVGPRARRLPRRMVAATGGGLSRSADAARRARKGLRRAGGGLGARGVPAEVSLLPVVAPVVLVLRPGPGASRRPAGTTPGGAGPGAAGAGLRPRLRGELRKGRFPPPHR